MVKPCQEQQPQASGRDLLRHGRLRCRPLASSAAGGAAVGGEEQVSHGETECEVGWPGHPLDGPAILAARRQLAVTLRPAGIDDLACQALSSEPLPARLEAIHARRPEFAEQRPDVVWDIPRDGSRCARAATPREERAAMQSRY